MPFPLLLVVIYAAFVSLGLPDSTLGVAWPAFRGAVGAPLEAAGLIAIVLTACSAVSSLSSGWVTRRFGTGPVVAASCVMTAVGLLGYSFAPAFGWVVVAALPLGFGQGAVDASLNAFVAAHYSSRHMNWLHASWGTGATLGPIIMSRAMNAGSYRLGYRIIGLTQGLLALVFISTLGLWSRSATRREDDAGAADSNPKAAALSPVPSLFSNPALWFQVGTYALYAACESSVGIWSASLLVEARGASTLVSGLLVSMYFGGIMAGRVIVGFVSEKLGNRLVVRLGLGVSLAGALLLWPHGQLWLAAPGLLLLGLGFAPVYPGLMHETPRRFGHERYQTVIGFQMAAAMLGASIFPGLVGLAASRLGLEILGPTVAGFILLLGATVALLDSRT